jgi:hypothetical protein
MTGDGSSSAAAAAAAATTRFFHPQHSASLLPRLQMEVTVESSCAGATVVFSQPLHHPSVHPSWEHLDERIHVPSSVTNCWWKDHDVYKSMRLKLLILTDKRETASDSTTLSDETTEMEFLEAPLHPSLLQRMDMGNLRSSTAASSQDGSDDGLFAAGNSSSLPPLPPNSLLVHFSDGSVRCLPHLYQILWDCRHVAQEPPVEDFDRFADHVFETLDHVRSTTQRRERTASSLLDQDHRDEQTNNIQPSQSQDSHEKDAILQHLQQEQQQEELAEKILKETRHLVLPSDFPYDEEGATAEDLAHQNKLLRRQMEREERLLEREVQGLQDNQAELKVLMQQLQEVEHEAKLVQSEVCVQMDGWHHDEVMKQAQGIKLLRDLRVIYPITLEMGNTMASSAMSLSFIGSNNNNPRGTPGGYVIRGLRLPVDIYTTTVPEEEINASLGYCAHLVFMIAKYLTIPLRHRIFCNSSRSAIQQDGVGVFPLFLGRMVARSLEREQVDRGARLLGANVNCVLMHLGMPESLQTQHILARLDAILNSVSPTKDTQSID